MRGVTGTASPAARLAAARLAHGAAQRDRRSDEEGRLYALLAAGYVLGTCVIGSAPADGSAEAPADGAVSRLRAIEQIGLAELVEAAGSTAGVVARELVDSSGARSSRRPPPRRVGGVGRHRSGRDGRGERCLTRSRS